MAEVLQQDKTRYELLAELWNVTVDEAKARDEQRRAQVAAETQAAENAATEGAPTPTTTTTTVKKTDVVDKKS